MANDPVILTDIADFQGAFQRFIAAGELRVARWADGGGVLGYAARAPAEDGARRVAWSLASGTATLHSFCLYHRAYHPDFPVPYNVALVELAEGPQLISTVIIDDLASLRVGMRLTAAFEPSGRLVFHPTATAASQ
jgi:uncharacterized protein